MNDPTVTLWIITEDDGRILCAHHVATDVWLGKGKPVPTLLVSYFTLKLNRIRGKLACTDKQCKWILPTLYSKDIPFAEVQDTDFRSATKLKQKRVEKFDVNAQCVDPGDSKTTEKQKRDIQAPTEAELNSFYEKLNT